MARIIPLVCVFILMLQWQQQLATCHPLLVLKELIEFPLELYNDYKDIKEIFFPDAPVEKNLTKAEISTLAKLDELSENIQDLKNDLFNKISHDLQNKITLKTDTLFQHAQNIQYLYDKFLYISKHNQILNHKTKKSFYKTIQSNDISQLSSTITQLHETLTKIDINHNSILSILSSETDPELMCVKSQSLQHIIIDLFKTVVRADTQYLIMKLYSYQSLKKNETEFTTEMQSEKEWFKDRFDKTYKDVKVALSHASRELWRCDPSTHEEGVTYDKLQEVFQGYVHFDRDSGNEACNGGCPKVDTDVKCDSYHCSERHARKPCLGYVRDCDDSITDGKVCLAPDNSLRRYDWTQTKTGNVSGQINNCANVEFNTPYQKKGAFSTCLFCLCTCVSEVKNIDRYISLSHSTSDILDNMIVTGIRLKKHRNIFYIELQQGKLVSNGTVDPNTVHWKKSYPNTEKSALYNVRWDQRTVYLDDLEPQKNKSVKDAVLIGINFVKTRKKLALELQMANFDYSTGKLLGTWNYTSFHHKLRTEKTLVQPLNPLLYNNHLDDTKPNTYIKFQPTDRAKDLEQSTIPFFDMQEIVSNPPVPMSGAGIFHKGVKHSGGFLALKLIEFDFTSFSIA